MLCIAGPLCQESFDNWWIQNKAAVTRKLCQCRGVIITKFELNIKNPQKKIKWYIWRHDDRVCEDRKKVCIVVLVLCEVPALSAMNTGHLISKKIQSYYYRDPHYKPKTVWRPSQFYNWNLYTNKAEQYAMGLNGNKVSVECSEVKLEHMCRYAWNTSLYIVYRQACVHIYVYMIYNI